MPKIKKGAFDKVLDTASTIMPGAFIGGGLGLGMGGPVGLAIGGTTGGIISDSLLRMTPANQRKKR